MQSVQWVSNPQQFAAMCDDLLQQDAIAIDTEFIRRTSYYPNAALFQFATHANIYLVDPLAIEDYQALKAILIDARITKVMHACWEDLEVFNQHLGVIPNNLVDTQLALAFANIGWSMGYHRMVQHLLDVELAKSATLTNWLKRPLSEEQLLYAQEDVKYLLPCFYRLKTLLQQGDKWHYLQQQCEDLLVKFKVNLNLGQYYKKVSGVHLLSHQQQSYLQALCVWREQQAQQKNLPRAWVVHDQLLLALALNPPATKAQLMAGYAVEHKKAMQYADALLDTLAQANTLTQEQWPEYVCKKIRFNKGHPALKWRCFADELAASLDVVTQLVLSKEDFVECFIPVTPSGWEFRVLQKWPSWKQLLVVPKLEQWVAAWDVSA